MKCLKIGEESRMSDKRTKTVFLGKFPTEVRDFFASQGMCWDDAEVALSSDLSTDGVDSDCYAVLTKDAVYCAEGLLGLEVGHTLLGKKTRSVRYEPMRFTATPLSIMEDPSVELLISSGRAVCKADGEDVQLFGFTSTYAHDATVFCAAVTELKNTGKIDPRTLEGEAHDQKTCPKCGRRYPDKGRRYCPNCLEKTGLAARMGKMFLRYKRFMALVFLTMLLSVGLSLVIPFISNAVLYSDVLDPNGRFYGKIGLLVLVIAATRLLSLLINLITGAVNAKVSADVTYDLKADIFSSLGRLSLPFFTNRQTGSLMTQINSDSSTIYGFFCDGFVSLVSQMIQLVALLVVMFGLNVELTLMTFLTIPLFFVSFRLISRLFEKLHARNWSRRASYNSLVSDVINGIRVVKAFSREDSEVARFGARSRASAEASRELEFTSARIYPFLGFFLKIGVYVVWFVGGSHVMKGEMSYGDLMTFTAYFSLVYSPIEMLADVTNWWSECLNALKRLFDIKDAKVEVPEDPDPIDKDLRGEVEFKNVSFSYVENRKVLKDISFRVEAGETLGIVGQTGAGKSTLVNLITRLYDPDDGQVLIDGIDVKKLSFACLRRNIAIVSQETYLFNGTILDNIRYARPDATLSDVIAASKAAHAHDFIVALPDGYQTRIGQGARQLSGGERQRVSIARALLKDPRILILDEATSAMDTQTERGIQEALEVLSRDRTTIMIAHRLSTLRDADFLISISDGRLVERGTASELMEQKGVYYKLYTLQAEALKNVGISEEVMEAGKGKRHHNHQPQ